MSESEGESGMLLNVAKDFLCGAILVALLLAAGCRHAPVVETGRSSFVVIEPRASAATPSAKTEAREPSRSAQYREAQLHQPAAQPIYPPKALAAKAGFVIVGVRITVSAEGRVSAIAPSIVSFTTPSPYADEFMAAVEAALRQWKFTPARIENIETVVSGDFSYARLTGSENVETQYELSFTFMASGGVQVLPTGR